MTHSAGMLLAVSLPCLACGCPNWSLWLLATYPASLLDLRQRGTTAFTSDTKIHGGTAHDTRQPQEGVGEMNAEILPRHRKRLADLMMGGERMFHDVALQVIANSDKAAREVATTAGDFRWIASLICHDIPETRP